MAQRGGQSVPSFVVEVAGETVTCRTKTRSRTTSTRIPPQSNSRHLGYYAKGDIRTVTFDRPGVVDVVCLIHSFMRARILVVPNSHYAVVAEDGKLSHSQPPAGKILAPSGADGMTPFTQEVIIPESGKPVHVRLSWPTGYSQSRWHSVAHCSSGVLLALAGALASLGQSQNSPGSAASSSGLTLEVLDSMHPLPGGLASLPPPPVPPGNPQSPDKIELGRMLFFDQRLSNDKSISCATCHDPHKAYSDDRSKAVGINHTELTRRTPSLLNTAYNPLQFWDGRTSSLEDQVLVPMLGRHEMGMPDPQTLVNRLRADPEYRRGFREVFHRDITRRDIQFAIASFERTLVTPRSAFDRYADGDKHALSVQQKRGLILFIGKASCHSMSQRAELYRQQVPCARSHAGPALRFRPGPFRRQQTPRGPPGVQDAGTSQRVAGVALHAQWRHRKPGPGD